MLSSFPILADKANSINTIVYVAVFVGIWVVSAIASAMNKKKEEERRRKLREELERAEREQLLRGEKAPPVGTIYDPQRPPLPPVIIGRDIEFPTPPPRQQRIPPKPGPAPRRQQSSRPQYQPAPPVAVPRPKQKKSKQRVNDQADALRGMTREQAGRAEPARPVSAAMPEPSVVASVNHPRAATVGATVIRKWLSPKTLRQQFILTEIFQKPVSMRERKW